MNKTVWYSYEETIQWLLSHAKETENGCLEFEKGFVWLSKDGYPEFKFYRRTINICRFLLYKPHEWKTNQVTRHRCHNKLCVNIEHLMKGSHQDNWKDNMYEPFTMPVVYRKGSYAKRTT
jgi:hypothetical protein